MVSVYADRFYTKECCHVTSKRSVVTHAFCFRSFRCWLPWIPGPTFILARGCGIIIDQCAAFIEIQDDVVTDGGAEGAIVVYYCSTRYDYLRGPVRAAAMALPALSCGIPLHPLFTRAYAPDFT